MLSITNNSNRLQYCRACSHEAHKASLTCFKSQLPLPI